MAETACSHGRPSSMNEPHPTAKADLKIGKIDSTLIITCTVFVPPISISPAHTPSTQQNLHHQDAPQNNKTIDSDRQKRSRRSATRAGSPHPTPRTSTVPSPHRRRLPQLPRRRHPRRQIPRLLQRYPNPLIRRLRHDRSRGRRGRQTSRWRPRVHAFQPGAPERHFPQGDGEEHARQCVGRAVEGVRYFRSDWSSICDEFSDDGRGSDCSLRGVHGMECAFRA